MLDLTIGPALGAKLKGRVALWAHNAYDLLELLSCHYHKIHRQKQVEQNLDESLLPEKSDCASSKAVFNSKFLL